KITTNKGTVTPFNLSATPAQTSELAVYAGTLDSAAAVGTLQQDGTWNAIFDNGPQGIFSKLLGSAAAVNISKAITNDNWSGLMAFFGSTGTPSIRQSANFTGTYNGGGTGLTASFPMNTLAGSMLVMVYSNRFSNLNRTPKVNSDTQAN